MENQNPNEPKLRATYNNVPDHSDLRGFSYRGPDSEDHPENNEKFELKAEDSATPASEIQASESEDSSPEATEGPQNVDIDEDDNEDVLEEVRGGLRADVPDDIEYDDTDANARRKVS